MLAYTARSEGLNQTCLASYLEIEPITLVRLIDRLEGMGLIERRLDPRDRRQRNLYLTEKAWPELERIRALGAEVREEALAGLDDGRPAAAAGGAGHGSRATCRRAWHGGRIAEESGARRHG